jgi:hypothetical protein
MYLADSFGYLGSVCLLLFKNFVPLDISLLEFFIRFSYVTAFACATGIIVPLVYFSATAKKQAAVRESLHSSSMASASIHTKNYPIK